MSAPWIISEKFKGSISITQILNVIDCNKCVPICGLQGNKSYQISYNRLFINKGIRI